MATARATKYICILCGQSREAMVGCDENELGPTTIILQNVALSTESFYKLPFLYCNKVYNRCQKSKAYIADHRAWHVDFKS